MCNPFTVHIMTHNIFLYTVYTSIFFLYIVVYFYFFIFLHPSTACYLCDDFYCCNIANVPIAGLIKYFLILILVCRVSLNTNIIIIIITLFV